MGDRVLADSTTLEACSAGAVDVAHSPGGTRLATASSSRRNVAANVENVDDDAIASSVSVAVYDGGSGSPLWTLTGGFSLPHGARPTKLAWAHPEFGQALAVAADDGTVGIWVEQGGPRVVVTNQKKEKKLLRRWQRVSVFEAAGRGAASCLSFAPAVHGPRLAVGWRDGLVRVYACRSPLVGCAAVSSSSKGADEGEAPSPSPPLPPPAEWELESEFEPRTPALPVTCLCWRPQFAGSRGDEAFPPMLVVGTAARRRTRQDGGGGGGGGGGNGGGNGGRGRGGGGTSSVWVYRAPLLRWTRACTLDDGDGGDDDADNDNEDSSSSNDDDVSAVAWAPAGSARAPERVATAAGQSVRVFALAGRADALVSAAAAAASTTTTNAPPPPSSLPLFAQKLSSSTATAVPPEAVLRHSARVWRLEWSPLLGGGAGWLAAGTEAGAVVLWRQNLRGEWVPQSAIVADSAGRSDDAGTAATTKLASSTVQQDASGLATVVV